MDIKILNEAGYEESLRGMAYSYYDNTGEPDDWWTEEKFERAKSRSKKLAFLGAGHNKFLRQITLWVDINAPRFWWSEFDTYKVGTVAQSTSTMHTLKKGVKQEHFDMHIPENALKELNRMFAGGYTIEQMKGVLPEAFLQRRIVTLNYQVLNTIIQQRWDHRLPQWEQFCKYVLQHVNHPEFLQNPYEK